MAVQYLRHARRDRTQCLKPAGCGCRRSGVPGALPPVGTPLRRLIAHPCGERLRKYSLFAIGARHLELARALESEEGTHRSCAREDS